MKNMSKLNPKYFYLRVQTVLELSVRLLSVLFYIGSYIFLNNFFESDMPVFAGILCIIVVYIVSALVYYFMRHMVSIVFFYLFVYCIAFVLVVVGDAINGAILPVLICMVTVSFIGAIIDCKKGYPYYMYSFRWFYPVLPVVMLIYAVYKSLDTYYVLAFAFGLLFTLGHFWCTYLNGMAKFMGENINLSNVPRSDIFKGNTRTVFFILFIFMATSGLIFMVKYLSIFNDIGSFIGNSVSTFVRRFLMLITFLRGLTNPEEEQDGEGTLTEPTLDDAQSSSELILNILGGICALLLLAFIVLWIIALIKRPRKPRKKFNIVYSAYEDDVEDLKPKEKGRWHLFKNNNEKVRHKFKRFIKKNLKPNVPRGKTAYELSAIAMHNLHSDVKALDREDFKEGDFLASEEDVKYEKLTTLYNVARYSGRMVTNEEMKEITR